MANPVAEILMIGTELLLGQIEDTNAGRIARAFSEGGINLYWKTTVGDNANRIAQALRLALGRADVVLCSGGLGPTADDITRECVAEVMGAPLEFHPDLFKVIEQRFQSRGKPLTENNRRQAMLPRRAAPICNPNGTAPGLIAETEQGIIVCLPGVPRELAPMLESVVLPYLQWRFGVQNTIHYRVLKVRGVGESRIDAAIADLILSGNNPTIGLVASPECVGIRIAARAATRDDAERMIAPVEVEVRKRLASIAVSIDIA